MNPIRLLSLLLLAALLPSCSMLDPAPTRPLPGEDIGPKPDARAFVAAWANKHYGTRSAFWKPEDIIVDDPVPIAYTDMLAGRAVGWQIIIGPENRDLSNCIGAPCTRLIVNHGRIVSEVSGNGFPSVR